MKPWSWFKRSRISNRTELLNYLIATFGYKDYLEIGVRDPRTNFDKVRVTGIAHGCDPAPRGKISHVMTSDAFFAQPTANYDLVLIDGLHLADQVERDIVNSLAALTPNGTLVVHDCNPLTEDAQAEELGNRKIWNGTVWKAWAKLRATRDDLSMWVVDMDDGCGVIRRGSQSLISLPSLDYAKLDYKLLERERRTVLNLIAPDELLRLLPARQVA